MAFSQTEYNASAAGRASRARYNASPKGKATLKRAVRRVRLALLGTTPEEWAIKFAEQNEACAACGSKEPGTIKGWHTDHDHRTGVFRGILCQPCNIALGWLEKEERNALLRKYLEKTNVRV